jgi:lipid-A-disaccharide synthase
MPHEKLRIMIVAGEASGDLHAAKLVRALREAAGERETEFFGSAGPLMRAAGVEPVVASDELSIVGLLEIGRALPMFIGAFRRLTSAARERKPDVAILVDFPDFNLKLAKSLKRQGINVVYYISPQLWAWRSYRVAIIRKYVDLMITILPFEKAWYAEQGVTNVEYVGSPLAKEVHPSRSKVEFCTAHDIDPERPIVALLPGSRHKEIVRILPKMIEVAIEMAKQRSDVQFIIALASEKSLPDVKRILHTAEKRSTLPESLFIIAGETFDVLNASDTAAVTSGTATLETAIIGTPMAIVYKTSAINYKLLRPLITVEHFGLVNLIAGERVATEMIQSEFTPLALSRELFQLLEPERNKAVRMQFGETTKKLGSGGASARAAKAIMSLLDVKQLVQK